MFAGREPSFVDFLEGTSFADERPERRGQTLLQHLSYLGHSERWNMEMQTRLRTLWDCGLPGTSVCFGDGTFSRACLSMLASINGSQRSCPCTG